MAGGHFSLIESRVQAPAAADTLFGGIWEKLQWGLNTPLFSIGETPFNAALALKLLLIISVVLVVSRLTRGALTRISARRPNLNPASVYTLGRVLHYTILAFGVLLTLSTLGLDLSKFALVASALSVGIGFGLQTIINNFIAGLLLLFERSIKVGDFLDLQSGVTGEVKEINIRSTLIRTNDNVDILVPNSEFVSGRVTNWTLREADFRLRVPFGVSYASDIPAVEAAALEAARQVDFTDYSKDSRQPAVWLTGFGESSLDFALVVWLNPDAVKRPGTVTAAYNRALAMSLKEAGIEIPFPQRDLHLRTLFDRPAEELTALLDQLGKLPGPTGETGR